MPWLVAVNRVLHDRIERIWAELRETAPPPANPARGELLARATAAAA